MAHAARPCRPAAVVLAAELGAQDPSLLQQELGLDLGRHQMPGPRVNATRDFQAGAIYKTEVSLLQRLRTAHLSLPRMLQHSARLCRAPALKLLCVVPPLSSLLPDCCTLQSWSKKAQTLSCSLGSHCHNTCLPLVLQDLVQPARSYKDRRIAQQHQRDQVVRLTNAEVRRRIQSEASMLAPELHW